MYATSGGQYGLYAASTLGAGYGVFGYASSGYAVYGEGGYDGVVGYGVGTSSIGVNGSCTGSSCLAGYFVGNVNVIGGLYVNNVCEFGCGSDERLKTKIEPLSSALDTLLRLKGVSFDWKEPGEHGKRGQERQTGFIAQEVERVVPQWVDVDEKGFKRLSIPPAHIDALEVEAIRQLKAENDVLTARLKKLEDERRPVISTNTNGIGFGIGALALAVTAVTVTRRKRADS
jgi:hypothetical protein